MSNDLTGSFSVARDVTLGGGQINIGRDMAGPVAIGGSLTINDGGQFSVIRNLGASTASTTTSATTASSSGAAAPRVGQAGRLSAGT